MSFWLTHTCTRSQTCIGSCLFTHVYTLTPVQTCTHTCSHAHTSSPSAHAHTCSHMCTLIPIHRHTPVHMCKCSHLFTHMHSLTHAHKRVHACTCSRMCTCLHLLTYVSTLTRAQFPCAELCPDVAVALCPSASPPGGIAVFHSPSCCMPSSSLVQRAQSVLILKLCTMAGYRTISEASPLLESSVPGKEWIN